MKKKGRFDRIPKAFSTIWMPKIEKKVEEKKEEPEKEKAVLEEEEEE